MPESTGSSAGTVAQPGSQSALYWVDTVTERYRFELQVEAPARDQFGMTVAPDAQAFFDWMERTIEYYAVRGYTLKHQITLPAAHVREHGEYDWGFDRGYGVNSGIGTTEDERGPYGYGYGYGWGFGYASAAHVPREAALVFERTELVSLEEYRRRIALARDYDHAVSEIARLRGRIDELNADIDVKSQRLNEIEEAKATPETRAYPEEPVRPQVKRRGKMFSEVYVVEGEEDTEYKKQREAEARADAILAQLQEQYREACDEVDRLNAEIEADRRGDADQEVADLHEGIRQAREEIAQCEQEIERFVEERDRLSQNIQDFRNVPKLAEAES